MRPQESSRVSNGTLLAPIFYAGGAALALGGGVLAMLAREAPLAGIVMAVAGIGIVTSTTLFQANTLMRPPTTNPEQE
jgi:hypothetical protein